MPNQSPIHAPSSVEPTLVNSCPRLPSAHFCPKDCETTPAPVPTRIARLAALDNHPLSSRSHSLGAGGASSLFNRAVEKALVDEMAEQLREGPFEPQPEDSDLRRWAGEIVAAFMDGDKNEDKATQ